MAPPPVQQSLIPDAEPVNPYLRTQPAQFDSPPNHPAPPVVQKEKSGDEPAAAAADEGDAELENAKVPAAPDWSLADPDAPKQAPSDKAG